MQTFDGNPPSRIGNAGATRNRRWWTLAVCTGVFMLLLDMTIVNVELPDIENTFTARSALAQGLNAIMLISAVVAFTAAVASFVLIRERDFVTLDEGEEEDLELAVAA